MFTYFKVLLFLPLVFGQSSVPALIWNVGMTGDKNVVESAPALQLNEVYDISDILSNHHNVLLFLQDELSIEDLSSHKSEFSTLTTIFESEKALYIPKVKDNVAQRLEHKLKKDKYTVSRIKAGTAISEIKLNEGTKNLVIIELPPTSTNPRRSHALKKVDEVISSVLDKVKGVADFVAVYTATSSSIPVSEDVARLRVSRSLKAIGDPSNPDTFYSNDCVFMYLKKPMTVSMKGPRGAHDALPAVPHAVLGTCNHPDTNNIMLNYNDVTLNGETLHKLKLNFEFKMDRGTWHSPTVTVDMQKGASGISNRTVLHMRRDMQMSAPVNHCFNCGQTVVYEQRTIGNHTTAGQFNLHVNGAQVQAFMGDAVQFGAVWDCEGFFTAGVWMGLLASGLATTILLAGMCMIADIKTMDRFDDPKGKPIMLTQAQE